MLLTNKRSWRQFGFILLVSLLAYSPLLGNKARNPDAGIILPPLFDVQSPLEYFSMLINFEVIDFQPVRDLTFFFDILIFKVTGIVTFATTNVLLWGIAVFLFLKLLERTVRSEKKDGLIFWTLAFAVYPLFSQVVSWGMARKHILAFLLILWTTNAFLDWMESKGSFFKAYLGYVLACLSHPITIFWPVWALAYHFMFANEEIKKERRKFSIYFLTAITLLFTNYAYYTVGNKKVAEAFGNIKPDYLDFSQNFLNFCFYVRQIFWPYDLSFQNFPVFSNSWLGMILLAGIIAFIVLNRKDRHVLSWSLFALFPFPIFVSLPAVFDQYLLIPASGLVLILADRCHNSGRNLRIVLIVLTLVWGSFTFRQARDWVNLREIVQRNFENSPSCKSAAELAMNYYAAKQKAPPEALAFLEKELCLAANSDLPSSMQISHMYIESLMLFYETERFSLDERLERLKSLAQMNYFPGLILAAIYAQEGKSDEIETICRDIMLKAGDLKLETGPEIDGVLRPYCEKEKLPACLKITVPNNVELPYL